MCVLLGSWEICGDPVFIVRFRKGLAICLK